MRRIDRALSESETKDILLKGEYGILSTVSADGQPYGAPLSYIYFEDAVYFHCAKEGHKLENLRTNGKASFCVVGKTEVLPAKFSMRYESVIVFGEASEVVGDQKRKALTELVKKYASGFLESGLEYIKKEENKTLVYRIAIKSITGKTRK